MNPCCMYVLLGWILGGFTYKILRATLFKPKHQVHGPNRRHAS